MKCAFTGFRPPIGATKKTRKLFCALLSASAIAVSAFIFFNIKDRADVLVIGNLPEGYGLSEFKKAEDDLVYLYTNQDGGYINIIFTPDSDITLQQYLKNEGVKASYTTILPSDSGMRFMYIYSQRKETVGVVQTSEGLLVIKSDIKSYDMSELIRSIKINSEK